MKLNYFFFLALLLTSCGEETVVKPEESIVIDNGTESSNALSFKIIFKENVGWGYQIFEGSKLMINQEHIPAVQGMHGFSSKEHAEIAANFVKDKIANGVFPPTLTPSELDSLGIYSEEDESEK